MVNDVIKTYTPVSGKEENEVNVSSESVCEMTGAKREQHCDVSSRGQFTYDVNEHPPILLNLVLAIQTLLTSFGANLLLSYTISDLACADRHDPIRGKLFCSSVFVTGLATSVQSAFGVRLPIFQGAAGSFLGPLLLMRTAGIWSCDDAIQSEESNITRLQNVSLPTKQELVNFRVTELQGSLMVAGLVTEVFLGATGCVGYIVRFIGPITVCVTITSLGLSLYPFSLRFVGLYAPIAICGVILMVVCILYLPDIKIPIPKSNLCRKLDDPVQQRRKWFPLFRILPFALTIGIMWTLCAILTVTGVLSDDPSQPAYHARTDSQGNLFSISPWFYFPYPGQFGAIRFNAAVFVGFISSYLVSCVESIGDYFSTSQATNTYPPPRHVFNRGILIEGLMGIVGGLLGLGHGTTSYSGNIAILKLTKVASRSVFILAGILCMLFGIIGKFGAFMASVPDPIIGSVIFFSSAMLVAIGLSSLQHVNLSLTRNLVIIGVSIYTGLFASEWLKSNRDAVDTVWELFIMYQGYCVPIRSNTTLFNTIFLGSPSADQVIKLIIGTPMFLAGLTSVVLDNTVKGTYKDRGMEGIISLNVSAGLQTDRHRSIYDFPGVNKLQRKLKLCRYIPFFQQYTEEAD